VNPVQIRSLIVDPVELGTLTVDPDTTADGRTFVALGEGGAYTAVTEAECLEISEAWRRVEQIIVERRYGAEAVA
jgi:hypothetical protein